MVCFTKFFKIISHASFPTFKKADKAVNKMIKLSTFVPKTFSVFLGKFKFVQNYIHFGEIKASIFYGLLLTGKFFLAFKKTGLRILNVADIKNLKNYFEQSANFLAHRFKKIKAVCNLKIPELKNVKNVENIEQLSKSNKYMKNIWTFFKKNWFKLTTYTTGATLVGTGIADALEKHRQNISGCIVFYTENGIRKSCKRNTLTCNNKYKQSTKINLCTDEFDTTLQKQKPCNIETISNTCVHCDSTEKDELNINYTGQKIVTYEDYDNDNDDRDIYFQCIEATFGNALQDALGNNVQTMSNILNNVVFDVADLLHTIFKYGKYLIIVIFLIISGLLFFKLKDKIFSQSVQYTKIANS